MTTRSASFRRHSTDHFEPAEDMDPHAQRRMRGQLEQIDYVAFAANKEVIGHVLAEADMASFQRLAVAAATARAQWVQAALAFTETQPTCSQAQIDRLAAMRSTYEELAEVYEALRRMVERSYLTGPRTPD